MIAEIRHGDCLELLKQLADNSIESVVTDPPYELGFMGKKWDSTGIAYRVDLWREVLRVLKPGGHLISFSGSRTYHRMAVAIEDAGFQIRDQILWIYGSGFPKSMDISKAFDKSAGVDREIIGTKITGNARTGGSWSKGEAGGQRFIDKTAPATALARQWAGWGTALKPAHEPMVLARKPLNGTVAENVEAWGTGGLNVDGCRVGTIGGTKKNQPSKLQKVVSYGNGLNGGGCVPIDAGRWPANLIHDGSPEAEKIFPNDASRFFYCAKANKNDRDSGLSNLIVPYISRQNGFSETISNSKNPRANTHPTVKPVDLMRYLIRLITPPGGLILDPFTGSGSTGKAAIMEGFQFLGMELEADYVAIAQARVNYAIASRKLIGSGGQCDNGLCGGNGNPNSSFSNGGSIGNGGTEHNNSGHIYGNKFDKVLPLAAPFQQLEMVFP